MFKVLKREYAIFGKFMRVVFPDLYDSEAMQTLCFTLLFPVSLVAFMTLAVCVIFLFPEFMITKVLIPYFMNALHFVRPYATLAALGVMAVIYFVLVYIIWRIHYGITNKKSIIQN